MIISRSIHTHTLFHLFLSCSSCLHNFKNVLLIILVISLHDANNSPKLNSNNVSTIKQVANNNNNNKEKSNQSISINNKIDTDLNFLNFNLEDNNFYENVDFLVETDVW